MTDLFLNLVNMSIAAGWLVLAVVVLRFLLKKAPRSILCVLWGLVAVRLIFPISIESALSLIPSAETVPPDIIYAQEPTIHTGIPALNSAVNPIITETFAPQGLVSINPIQGFLYITSIVWILGMVLMAGYAVFSYLRVRKQVAAAIRQSDNIYICDYISTPFILGLFRPRIYLPSSLSEANAAHVIAHEEAHLARRDHWWKPLGYVLLTVYWFNPLMWLAYILLCRDIELACDEKVVKEMDGPEKQAYSAALLGCSTRHRTIAACPLAFGEVGVKARVKSVLNYKKPAFWIILLAVITCIVAAVCFLTNPEAEINDGEDRNYSFNALVLETAEKSLLVEPQEGTDERRSADRIWVSTDKATASQFKAGDTVYIYYDGVIAESYPAQIHNTYMIRAYTEGSGPPAASSYGSFLVGDLLAQDMSLSFQPETGYARITLSGGELIYSYLNGQILYSGDTYTTASYDRKQFAQEVIPDLTERPFLPGVLSSTLTELLDKYDPDYIELHQYYLSNDNSAGSNTVFYFDGVPTWFSDGWRLYELEPSQPDTAYQVVSGSRSVPAVAFPERAKLQSIADHLYTLELSLNPEITVPFDVLLDGEAQYGAYSIYDAKTLESLDFFRPSGLSPQTFLLQNAELGKTYIVSMQTDDQVLYFKIRLPEADDWGITLTASNVTPTGMTLVCKQDGGNLTDYLITGSGYWLEELSVGWHEIPHDQLWAFTTEAYRIPFGDTIRWKISWEHVLDSLPAGTYRVCKSITQGSDNTQTFYAEFTIE